jgi:MoxR-like ATPase
MPDLLIIRAPQQPEASVTLNGQPMVIGSDPGCQIVVNDPSVLPHHAYIGPEEGVWRVMAYDAGSALKFEDRSVADLRLEKPLRFAIGNTQIEFTRDSAPPPPRASAPVAEPVTGGPEADVAQLNAAIQRIRAEMARVVIGQSEVVNQILVALFARGHCLLVGTPGLAKTLMARTLADSLELACKRVQFTPDLMPADITGTQVLEQDAGTGVRNFRFKQGPIFTNLLLADEINRTPPKTQAALLEAMQERRVTISGQTYDLPAPFFVIATQNPIEQEGTYPLPEAQLDRFMFSVKVAYPSAADEERIIMETTQDAPAQVARVLSAEALIGFQALVRKTPVSRHVGAYVTRLVRATRPDAPDAPDFIKNWVRWGAGPRAGQYLILAAKSNALLQGRLNVSSDDVRAYALPVLRHRVLCNFAAASEGVDSDEIVRRLLAAVPEPDYAAGE